MKDLSGTTLGVVISAVVVLFGVLVAATVKIVDKLMDKMQQKKTDGHGLSKANGVNLANVLNTQTQVLDALRTTITQHDQYCHDRLESWHTSKDALNAAIVGINKEMAIDNVTSANNQKNNDKSFEEIIKKLNKIKEDMPKATP